MLTKPLNSSGSSSYSVTELKLATPLTKLHTSLQLAAAAAAISHSSTPAHSPETPAAPATTTTPMARVQSLSDISDVVGSNGEAEAKKENSGGLRVAFV